MFCCNASRVFAKNRACRCVQRGLQLTRVDVELPRRLQNIHPARAPNSVTVLVLFRCHKRGLYNLTLESSTHG